MANSASEFINVIDTASATLVRTDVVHIASVRWVSNGASAGDQVIIKDGVGATIWETRATGNNYVEESKVPLRATGFAVTTLTSGTVYLYHNVFSRP